MAISADTFSRIDKISVDRDESSPEEAAKRRAAVKVPLVCGQEVAGSATLQAAVITAANIANRCFPNSVSLHFLGGVEKAPNLLAAPGKTISAAIRGCVPSVRLDSTLPVDGTPLVFGTRPDIRTGLHVTFNGWIAAAAPVESKFRLPETEACVIAGAAAGALAMAEVVLAFFNVTPEATNRMVSLSLWRPDLHANEEDAVGPAVEYLPAEWLSLGLGHLGQGYLWSLGLLPFSDPGKVNVVLVDFDRFINANVETGMVTRSASVGLLKTQVAAAWLRRRGFQPRLIERKFDGTFRRQEEEPRLAFCGFDGSGPRECLDDAGFTRVLECGLGDRFDNFDRMLIHTMPLAAKKASEVWSKSNATPSSTFAESLAKKNRVYREHDQKHICGALEIAGKGVAVPFVGTLAGSLLVSEALRMLHGGKAFESISLQMASRELPICRAGRRDYSEQVPELSYQRTARVNGSSRAAVERN
jgi:hypothetical protein